MARTSVPHLKLQMHEKWRIWSEVKRYINREIDDRHETLFYQSISENWNGIVSSTVSTSALKRFKILPVGLVSKNDIGLRITLWRSCLCIAEKFWNHVITLLFIDHFLLYLSKDQISISNYLFQLKCKKEAISFRVEPQW